MRAWRRSGTVKVAATVCPVMVWNSVGPGGGELSWTWDLTDPDEWELEFGSSINEGGPFEGWAPFDTSPVGGDARFTDTAWAIPAPFYVQARIRSVVGANVGEWCYGPAELIVE